MVATYPSTPRTTTWPTLPGIATGASRSSHAAAALRTHAHAGKAMAGLTRGRRATNTHGPTPLGTLMTRARREPRFPQAVILFQKRRRPARAAAPRCLRGPSATSRDRQELQRSRAGLCGPSTVTLPLMARGVSPGPANGWPGCRGVSNPARGPVEVQAR